MSKTFYIFRHGITYFSKKGLPYGDKQLTAEILPEGVQAIERMAEHLGSLPIDHFYSSELLRCTQTAHIVSRVTHIPFETDARLNELTSIAPESFNDSKERVEHFLKMVEESPDTSIAICTHGAIIAALKHLLTTGSYNLFNLMDYPKSGVLLTVEGKTVTSKDFND